MVASYPNQAIERRKGLTLAAPAAVLIVVLVLVPLVTVLVLSLTDYRLGDLSWRFVGLSNYAKLASDPAARRAVVNTTIYVGTVVPAAVGIGLFLALNIQARRRLRRFYEVIFFLPVTSTFVAMALVWQYLLHGRIGPINAWMTALGWRHVDFLTDPSIALFSLAAIGVWQLVGFNTILFLAGLAAIPGDLYEAAELDGMQGGMERFLRLTWPLLTPTTLFVTVTTSITAFQVFDSVAALTRGGPMGSTEVLLFRLFQDAYGQFEIGYGAALSVVFLGIILAFASIQTVLSNRRSLAA